MTSLSFLAGMTIVEIQGVGLVGFVALRPKSTAMVIAGRYKELERK